MKRILMVAAASILAACPALAADLPVRTVAPAYYPVPVVYDWGGGYIGINGVTPSAKASGEAIHSIRRALVRPGTSTSTGVWSAAQWVLVGSLAHGWSASKAILIGKVSAAPAAVRFAPASLLPPTLDRPPD
jgi:hypothetical protein